MLVTYEKQFQDYEVEFEGVWYLCHFYCEITADEDLSFNYDYPPHQDIVSTKVTGFECYLLEGNDGEEVKADKYAKKSVKEYLIDSLEIDDLKD